MQLFSKRVSCSQPTISANRSILDVLESSKKAFLESLHVNFRNYDQTFRKFLEISANAIFVLDVVVQVRFTTKLAAKILLQINFANSKQRVFLKSASDLAKWFAYVRLNKK